jgi:hypothetical protein
MLGTISALYDILAREARGYAEYGSTGLFGRSVLPR